MLDLLILLVVVLFMLTLVKAFQGVETKGER
jgi:hypothetical protein